MDQCHQDLQYLCKILLDPKLPYTQKQEVVSSLLTEYLDLKTMNSRVNFVICLIIILYILSTSIHSIEGFYLLIKNLIKAIKEGRISKAMGRFIVKRMKKKGILIPPDLLKAVGY